MSKEKQFFVGVKAVIIKGKKILLLKDAKKDFWDFPGGRIDGNEGFHATLRRELSEELPGSKNAHIGKLITAYRVPRDVGGGGRLSTGVI